MAERVRALWARVVPAAREQWGLTCDSARQAWRLLRRERGLLVFVLALSIVATTEMIIANTAQWWPHAERQGRTLQEMASDFESRNEAEASSPDQPLLSQALAFLDSHGVKPEFSVPEVWPAGAGFLVVGLTSSLTIGSLAESPEQATGTRMAFVISLAAAAGIVFLALWSGPVGLALGWTRAVAFGLPFVLGRPLPTLRRWGTPIFLFMVAYNVVSVCFTIILIHLWGPQRNVDSVVRETVTWILSKGPFILFSLAWIGLLWWLASDMSLRSSLRYFPRALWRGAVGISLVCLVTGTAAQLLWFPASFAFDHVPWYSTAEKMALYPYHAARMAVMLYGTVWLFIILRSHREAAAPAGTMPYTA